MFLDILGQRDSLRQLKGLPGSQEELNRFLNQIRDTFGKVDLVRKGIKTIFADQSANRINETLVKPEQLDQFKTMLAVDPHVQTFSDSVVMAVSLSDDNEYCTALNGIHSSFLAAGGVLVGILAAKAALRAGVAIGLAGKMSATEIYGPALERAVFLESTVAQYPRLVVGEEVVKYLESFADYTPQSIYGQWSCKTASNCLKMLVEDKDGQWMIDFLGEDFTKRLDNLGQMAFAHVKQQPERYELAGNEKLAGYYRRLGEYFESRRNFWSVPE